MKIAYIANSNQSKIPFLVLEKQLKELNVEKIVIESTLDKVTTQTAFQRLVSLVQPGEELIIFTLDHLDNRYHEIRDRVTTIQSKEVNLIVLDAEFLNFNTANTQFNELGFQLFLQILEDIPRMKNIWIRKLQWRGIEHAKKKGIYKGRLKVYSESAENPKNRSIYFQVKDMLLRNFPITSIENMTGVSRNRIYRIKKSWKNNLF